MSHCTKLEWSKFAKFFGFLIDLSLNAMQLLEVNNVDFAWAIRET